MPNLTFTGIGTKEIGLGVEIAFDFLERTIKLSGKRDIKVTYNVFKEKRGDIQRSFIFSNEKEEKRLKRKTKEIWKVFNKNNFDVTMIFDNVNTKVKIPCHGFDSNGLSDFTHGRKKNGIDIASFITKNGSLVEITVDEEIGPLESDDHSHRNWINLDARSDSAIRLINYIKNMNFAVMVEEGKEQISVDNMTGKKVEYDSFYIYSSPKNITEHLKRITYHNGLCYCELLKCKRPYRRIDNVTPVAHIHAQCDKLTATKKKATPIEVGESSDDESDIDIMSLNNACLEISSDVECPNAASSSSQPYIVQKAANHCEFCGEFNSDTGFAFDCSCPYESMCLKCSLIISRYCTKRDIEFKCLDCNREITEARVNLKPKRQRKD